MNLPGLDILLDRGEGREQPNFISQRNYFSKFGETAKSVSAIGQKISFLKCREL
jgi:hypothetical protein